MGLGRKSLKWPWAMAKASGWKSKGNQAAKSWGGAWKCQCGKVQTPSQCKMCRNKGWDVDWKHPPGGAPQGQPTPCGQAPRAPQTSVPSVTSDPMFKFISQVLEQLGAPGEEGAKVFKEIAVGLRTAFQAATKISLSNRLKSVLDKVKFKVDTATGYKAEIKQLSPRLEELEWANDEVTIELATLEEERAQLCDSVIQRVETDSEWSDTESQESPPKGKDHDVDMRPSTQVQGQGQARAEEWLAGLSPQEINKFYYSARKAIKRPRTSTPTPTEETCDSSESDEENI